MALFGIGRKKEEEAEANAPAVKAPSEARREEKTSPRKDAGGEHFRLLKNPRITEKATASAAESVYVFDITRTATKRSIADAISRIYGVRARAVRIVPVPTKTRRSMRTGRTGVTRRGRKAYVYLKKGETINIA